MTSPKYQDIKKDSIPQIDENGFQWKLVAGNYAGLTGPATTFSPIIAMMCFFKEGGKTQVEIPETYNVIFYILDGTIETNGQQVTAGNMVSYEQNGLAIQLESLHSGKLLLLAGEPINEPVSSSGPFVMIIPVRSNRQSMIMKAVKWVAFNFKLYLYSNLFLP